MTDADLKLASEFATPTRDDWMKLVETVLKGAPFDKKLVSFTADGIRIEPVFPRRADRAALAGRTAGTAWRVVQRVDHPDPAKANAQALEDLENGATGLTLVFAGAIGARGFGLPPTPQAISTALGAVVLDAIALDFDLGPEAAAVPGAFAALVAELGVAPAALDVRFGLDPLGSAAVRGGLAKPWPQLAPAFAAEVAALASAGFRGPFAVADGRPVHDAGGSEAQELAFVLAAGVAYLRALEAGGIPLDDARRFVYARLVADADQFLTQAKFRALRRLWARVEAACGLTPLPLRIAGETAWRMMTRRDPWVNLLRGTVATFAAGTGGVDDLTVLPFTSALGLADPFARRMARNTQVVLIEESHLDAVADPGAGAGGLEALTDELIAHAWTLFQQIEAAGGLAKALETGLIQDKVGLTRAEHHKAVARRKEPITGVSEFPLIAENEVAVPAVEPVVLPQATLAVTFEPLHPGRLAEPFEALRDASDRALATAGARPRLFLANLGPIAAFTARATFAKNFFETGGIETVSNDGFATDGTTDLAALVAAFQASGAPVACICSSDPIYAEEAAAAAAALTAAGAKHLWLAGRLAAELEGPVKAAGVAGFVFVGADLLAVLGEAHRIIGV
ncbi:methylmalonyl-CoA mutase subunit beta [Blastochloris viridis]|uniref:Methylmalonyl-CoA mutase n=1 Tax=Blastochloris viridis TaxID=1079 RepID=A0A0H5BBM9_BLAVI|nr:methylmalonyl-CoA mutase subunit beta [Blastochloris viridis]ALK10403.1 Methylmalonyl-CoA mutase small subunit [Blastochloris viridis]BAR99657.1 methylmalonyl-CoA mutase [Blastochloris viridis]CUU43065.1 Methylmalonyl-CoA mutase small subunit [Blastochloris viridis]